MTNPPAGSSAKTRRRSEEGAANMIGTPVKFNDSDVKDPRKIVDICTQNLTVIRDFLMSCKEGIGKKQNCLLAVELLQRGLQHFLALPVDKNSANVINAEQIGEIVRAVMRETANSAPVESAPTPAPSFAEVTARNAKSTEKIIRPPASQNKRHKVIIKPNTNCTGIKSAEDTKKLLMTKKPEEFNVRVDRIVNMRDNTILVESKCSSVLKLADSAALKSLNLTASPVNKNWPRMQILDVAETKTAEEITEDLKNQGLPDSVPDDFIGKIFKYGRKQGNNSTTSWIVELHPAARSHFAKVGRFYTAWRSHVIRDFLLVSRCFQCQRFGHIAKYCKSTTQCGYCASTEHESRNCNDRENPANHKCANCIRSGARDVNHHTAQDSCPIRRHRIQEQIDATLYEFDG